MAFNIFWFGLDSEVGGQRSDSGRRDALQEFEFVPPRVEVRDFVSRRFQLSFQIENLRARFRIKIRRGKRGLKSDTEAVRN